MTTTNWTCKNCCHFSPAADDFRRHVAKHGVDMTLGFEITTLQHSCGSGWSQVIEKISTKQGYDFFKTTNTIDLKSGIDLKPGQMSLGGCFG